MQIEMIKNKFNKKFKNNNKKLQEMIWLQSLF